jgi:hypothetical protein
MDDREEHEAAALRFCDTLEAEVRLALQDGADPKSLADAMVSGAFMLAARLAGDRAPAVGWLHKCADEFARGEAQDRPH